MQTGPREEEVRAANEIFTLLAEGHGLAVILDALAGRNGVSDEARSELSNRIRKLRIKGFRDANRAPHDRLVETILEAIAEGDHGLAAAILGTWMQTKFGAAGTGRRAPAGTRHRRRRRAAGAVHQLLGYRRVAARTQPDASGQRRRPCAPRQCRADAEPGVGPVSRPPAGRIRALQDLDRHAVGPARVSARVARRRGQPGQVDPLHPAREGTRLAERKTKESLSPVATPDGTQTATGCSRPLRPKCYRNLNHAPTRTERKPHAASTHRQRRHRSEADALRPARTLLHLRPRRPRRDERDHADATRSGRRDHGRDQPRPGRRQGGRAHRAHDGQGEAVSTSCTTRSKQTTSPAGPGRSAWR